jgi:hypothetical protein
MMTTILAISLLFLSFLLAFKIKRIASLGMAASVNWRAALRADKNETGSALRQRHVTIPL